MSPPSVMISHCGRGTTMKAPAAGVPIVCRPMGRDQNDTAARVVHAGAGVRPRPDASAATIASATDELLTQPRYREAARRLAWAIADEHRAIDPVTELERVVRNETRRAVAV